MEKASKKYKDVGSESDEGFIVSDEEKPKEKEEKK
jgi:hypothetical protein